MKTCLFALAACCPGMSLATPPDVTVPIQETCREYITSEPRLTMEEWPREARGRELNAYVVVSYGLDGSGKARDLRVMESKPKRIFDKTTLSMLERTTFAAGVQTPACIYVRTYGSVIRRER